MLYCDACTSVTAGVICPTCVISRQKTIEDLTYGRWSDCSFLVGNESHQEVIPGHKMILAMASPVFDVMFYSTTAANNPGPIRVDDTKPEIFRAMLQYIYTCKLTLKSSAEIYKLCYLAKKYKLQNLLTECITFLRLELTEENVNEIDEHAKLFDIGILKKACLEIYEQITKGNQSGSSSKIKKERKILSRSTKEVGVDRRLAEATFRFTIQNISKLKENNKYEAITPPYYIWNLPWQLEVENSEDNKHVQMTIICNSYKMETSHKRTMRITRLWNCWAKSELRIIPHKPDVMPLRNVERKFDLYDKSHDVWIHKFVTWDELLDPANEYIKDDTLILEMKLTVEEPEGIKSELDTLDTFFMVKTEPVG